MTWDEVKKEYPNKFVKIRVIKDHIKDNIRFVEEMEVIKSFSDNLEATRELVRTKDDTLVYHTGKDKIEIEIKQLFGFRGAV